MTSELTSTEAAARIGCTRQNVSDLLRRGRITGPPRSPGDPVLVYSDSVAAYLRDRDQPARHPQFDNTVASGSDLANHSPAAVDSLRREVGEALVEIRRLNELVSEEGRRRDFERRELLSSLDLLRQGTFEAREQALNARLAENDAKRHQLKADAAELVAEREAWALGMRAGGLHGDLRAPP